MVTTQFSSPWRAKSCAASFNAIEHELGVDPVLFAVLSQDIDDDPIMAVGDAVVVVDLGELVDELCLLCHILIPCFCGLPIMWQMRIFGMALFPAKPL